MHIREVRSWRDCLTFCTQTVSNITVSGAYAVPEYVFEPLNRGECSTGSSLCVLWPHTAPPLLRALPLRRSGYMLFAAFLDHAASRCFADSQ